MYSKSAVKCEPQSAHGASWATWLAAKLNEHLDGQRRVVHGDLGNEPGLVYAQEFFVEVCVVHEGKLAA